MNKKNKIKIIVNGKVLTVNTKFSLKNLVEKLKTPISKVAIELNEEIIDKKKLKKIFLKNEDKVETLKNSFNMKNWFDVYRLTMLSVENLYQDTNHLDDYTEYFDNIILDNETSITNIVKKQKKVSLNKNILILISILTQITALLFLLILFRNMLRNK